MCLPRPARFPQWARQHGITLTEVTIAMGIASVLGLLTASFLSKQQPLINEIQASFAMQELSDQIATAAASPEVLRFSAQNFALIDSPVMRDNNQDLLRCIKQNDAQSEREGRQASDCEITKRSQARPIDLILPFALTNNEAQDRAKVRRATIAGGAKDEQPITYTMRGAPCGRDNPNPRCRMHTEVKFWATCPAASDLNSAGVSTVVEFPENVDNPTPEAMESQAIGVDATLRTGAGARAVDTPDRCRRASTIHISYRVRHDFTATTASRRRGSLPRQLEAIPAVDFSISTPVAAIPNPNSLIAPCPPGESVVAIKDGEVDCECAYPKRREIVLENPDDPDNPLLEVCRGVEDECGEDERFVGTWKYRGTDQTICGETFGREDEGKPMCCPLECAFIPFGQACPNGGFIRAIKTQIDVTAVNADGTPINGACTADVCKVGKDGGSCAPSFQGCGQYTLQECCHDPISY